MNGKVGTRDQVARVILHEGPVDMVVKGGKVVNVHSGEIYRADVSVVHGRIAHVGDCERYTGSRTKVVDATGKFVTPGLVDGHLHFYHTYTTITEFSKIVLAHGTTTTVDGFYGPAIISGTAALRASIKETRSTHLKVLFLVPMIAYSQNREFNIKPTPRGPTARDLIDILNWPECFGLEEPQPSIVLEMEKPHIRAHLLALQQGKVINGHASGLDQRQIEAYSALGAFTDHESIAPAEVVEKVRAGIKAMARQGTSWSEDVHEVMRAVTENGISTRNVALCTDALPPGGIEVGGVDLGIRNAISEGIDPVTAIYWATLSIAESFRVNHEIGSLAPGRIADILLVDDLQKFRISTVIANGVVVARDYRFVGKSARPRYPRWMYETVRLPRRLRPEDFEIPARTEESEVVARTIVVPYRQIITPEKHSRLKVEDGRVQPDPSRGVIKVSMADRFGKGTGIANAFVENLGIREGAVGTTENAVCENLMIAGTNARDMATVANELARIGGGMIFVVNGKTEALVELPLYGLLSDDRNKVYFKKWEKLNESLKRAGWKHDTMMALEFVGAAGAIGHLKMTDQGLLDVDNRKIVDVIVR